MIPILRPKSIVLVTTFRCNASCEGCCFGCNPNAEKSMTISEIKYYIDTCLQEYKDSISLVVLTGGECMIDKETTRQAIIYATSLGLTTRIVTNAFWAKSYQDAILTMKDLKNCGLSEINFSTGKEHRKFIKFRNVRNAAVASVKLGYKPYINWEFHPDHVDSVYSTLINDKIFYQYILNGDIQIENGIWMTDNSNKININNTPNYENNKSCPNLFNSIPINPYGDVMTCCGLINERSPFFRLGNLLSQPNIKLIYEQSFKDFLKIWIHTDGPNNIIKILNSSQEWDVQYKNRHICETCRDLISNPNIENKLRNILTHSLISNIILKYNILHSKEVHES